MIRYIYIAIIIIWSLSTCTKEADIKIPESGPKPVITCFISPDQPQLSVRITLSVGRFGIDSTQFKKPIVNDAQVRIQSEQRSIELNFDPTQSIYTASDDTVGFIRSGRTYTLTVITSTFGIITATTQVPLEKILCDSINAGVYQSNQEILTVRAYLKGSPNEYNRLGLMFSNLLFNSNNIESPLDSLISPGSYLSNFEEEGVLKRKSFQATQEVNTYFYDTLPLNLILKSQLSILQCDAAFYKYHSSLKQAFETNGNPFADPVMVYSNIPGGMGCFGSYRLETYTYRKKIH